MGIVDAVSKQRHRADQTCRPFSDEYIRHRQTSGNVSEFSAIRRSNGCGEPREVLLIRFEEDRCYGVHFVRPHVPDDDRHIGSLVYVTVVRLEGVPTRLFLESQDHQHDLIRELQLIDIGERFDSAGGRSSQRVASLITEILAQYEDVRAVTRRQALAALERGDDVMSLDVPVRDGMADALRRWLELLEEADRLALDGELLLVPSGDAVRQLRRWYAAEIVVRLAAS